MVVILLEALAALFALLFIVWWTMFSGRPKGEPPERAHPPSAAAPTEVPIIAERLEHTDAAAPSAPPVSDKA